MAAVDAGPVARFVPGVPVWCELPGVAAAVIVCRHEGMLYAVVDRCGHQQRSMEGAQAVEGVLTCPHHGVCYRLETGEVVRSKGFRDLAPLRRVAVYESGGHVWLDWELSVE